MASLICTPSAKRARLGRTRNAERKRCIRQE
nr:MAG TPA: hypothetical protein [Caudoviricetes sp.]